MTAVPIAEMPEHISWTVADGLLRNLGFSPHQVHELHITRNAGGHLIVKAEVRVNNQTIVRTYDTGVGVQGVRVATQEQANQEAADERTRP